MFKQIAETDRMNIYFVRHGLSEGNKDHNVYKEKLDCHVELSEEGIEQCIDAAGELLELIDPMGGVFYVSPFKRTKDTAKFIMDEMFRDEYLLPENFSVIECPLITERAWGGLREVVNGRRFDSKVHFNFFNVPPDGGESFHQCYQRVVMFFQELRANHKKNEQIIIISHGEWIRLALMYLDGTTVEEFENKRVKVNNCQVIHREFKN